MAYKVPFTILLCIFGMRCSSQSYLQRNDLELLVKYYHELSESNTSKAQKAFFDIFPDTWLPIVRAEGFMNDLECENFMEYVDTFGCLEAIDDSAYCNKLVNLCIGAKLDADGPNYLHALLRREMGFDMNDSAPRCRLYTILSILSKKLKGDLMSFFYWSEPFLEEDGGTTNDFSFSPEFYRLQAIIKKDYPTMIEPMTIAYIYFHHGVKLT